MKIIVAGNGKVGETLIEELSAEGHDLTLIDVDTEVVEDLVGRYDVMAVTGNCAALGTLCDAGVESADLLIAATGTDEVNLLSCAAAHAVNPKIHTIARVCNPEYSTQAYRMRDALGLSLSFNPELEAAEEIEKLLKYPGFLKRDTFAKGRVEIVELKIEGGSPLADLPVSSLYGTVRCKVLICVVLRDGEAKIPDGRFVLRAGDRVFFTASTENLAALLKNLGIVSHKVRDVMIVGGGRVTYYLADKLGRSGIRTKIIEKDSDRCLELAKRLPNADIIHGDVAHRTVMEGEGISECDALVTLTGLDELNMIISLYGKTYGVPQIITKVARVEDSKILDSLPIGSVISPRKVCCNAILRYVRAMQNQAGAAITVHRIADGNAEALEFRVDEHTRNTGVPLKKLHTRENSLIACITRAGQIEIPNGDSVLHIGDTVVVVYGGDTPLLDLNDIFVG